MSGLRIGALFAGYGGLDMAVQDVWPDAKLAWYSEIDKGACKILAHRFPDVPNVGDVTAVDWSQVEPVDVITGGSPCQDLSHAGRRAGMTEGTRSNLWVAMREAIAQLRPAVVVWENVRGAYSAGADSELESDARLLAGVRRRDGEPVLRALGRVLGDLSDLGYVGGWHGLRAADVGAPHGRFRVFVVATDAQHDGRLADPLGRGAGTGEGVGRVLEPQGSPADPRGLRLLATPQGRDHKGVPSDGFNLASLPRDVSLLPTPAVNDMGEGKTVERWDEWTADMQAKHGNGNGHGKSLAIEAQRLLPTPVVQHSARNSTAGRSPDAKPHADGDTLADLVFDGRLLPTPTTTQRGPDARLDEREGAQANLHNEVMDPEKWGDYAAAIARWEHTLGRPAPAPTMTSAKGNPQLSPAFVEWLMGLPAGHITDVPGITRNEALKACGNGVVPQQAAAAIRWLLAQGVVA